MSVALDAATQCIVSRTITKTARMGQLSRTEGAESWPVIKGRGGNTTLSVTTLKFQDSTDPALLAFFSFSFGLHNSYVHFGEMVSN